MATVAKASNESAALIAFAAWLTTGDAVTFGSSHDAAVACELVDAFIKSQGYDDPPEGWADALKPYPWLRHLQGSDS